MKFAREFYEQYQKAYALANRNLQRDKKLGLSSTPVVLEDILDMQDKAYSALAKICQSSYKDAMETVLEASVVQSLAEYEEMTEEEKEFYLKEQFFLWLVVKKCLCILAVLKK